MAPYTYQLNGVDPGTGNVLWSQKTDWIEPPFDWIPSCGSCIGPDNRVYTPGVGGTVYVRSNADDPNATVSQVAFYGISSYNADPADYNSNVKICTPITVDAAGNIFFGFDVTNGTFNGLQSGLARISATGVGTWVACDTANGLSGTKITNDCTPALSNDGSSVYIATRDTNDYGNPYLVQLDSTSLATLNKVYLVPPPENGNSATFAYILDEGTASPMVGPDGDVYFGIWWSDLVSRGFMLHYSGDLQTQKPAGAFGWDDTASVVPASAVPAYQGSSSYLVLTKYNNYSDSGIDGDGLNRVAILDPNATEQYTVQYGPTHNPPNSTGPTYTCMNEVMTIVGPTQNSGQPGVREWCINSAVIDVPDKAAIINSEDGHVYRWDLTTGNVIDNDSLAPPTGEAYTPTLATADGLAFAVNDQTVDCLWDGAIAGSVSFASGNIASGDSTQATLSLVDQASANATVATGPGATFKLSSSNPKVTVPATVTVLPGQGSVSFTVSSSLQATDQTAVITATRYNFSTSSSTLTVHNSELNAVSLTASTVYSGQSGSGQVTLNGAAPGMGRTVSLSSNEPITFGSSNLTITGGSNLAGFTFQAAVVGATTSGTVTATLDDSTTVTTPITVNAPIVTGLTIRPALLAGGANANMTVTTNYATPATGIQVSIGYSADTSGPASVAVGPSNQATVQVHSRAVVSSMTETVTASFESSSAAANVTIAPAGTVAAFISSIAPTSATAGGPSFTLKVKGTNFDSACVVFWNASALSATLANANLLEASVPASFISSGQVATITAVNSSSLASNSAKFTVKNPPPSIGSILPTSVAHGSGTFTLTVFGSGFVPTSVVKWSGKSLPTTFVAGGLIRATVAGTYLKSAGTATITVVNPKPGGGVSNGATLTKS